MMVLILVADWQIRVGAPVAYNACPAYSRRSRSAGGRRRQRPAVAHQAGRCPVGTVRLPAGDLQELRTQRVARGPQGKLVGA